MARTVDEVLREYLGNQVVQLISLTAEVERLRAEVVTLDQELMALKPGPAKPNGRDHSEPAPVSPPARPAGGRQ